MTIPVVDAALLSRILPMEAAVDALESAYAGALPDSPLRSHLAVDGADLLVMPAAQGGGAGVKLVTVNPANPDRGLPLIHGIYALFAPGTLAPAAILDGAALTGIRTAAVSGLATRHLAREDASRLVIFGAGTQARTHLEAMRAVRPIERVTIVSRTAQRAEALAERARELSLEARVGVPRDVGEADIVCTCTTSPEPVVRGAELASGVHVNAVGAYTTTTRELDAETLRRAALVAVETRDVAMAEAGDVVLAIEEGAVTEDDLVELSEVVGGRAGRSSSDDVTVFKSVGVAFEDLVVARAAAERLEAGA